MVSVRTWCYQSYVRYIAIKGCLCIYGLMINVALIKENMTSDSSKFLFREANTMLNNIIGLD